MHVRFVILISKVKFVFHKNFHRKGWDQKDFIVELEVKMNTGETCLHEDTSKGELVVMQVCPCVTTFTMENYTGIVMAA